MFRFCLEKKKSCLESLEQPFQQSITYHFDEFSFDDFVS